MNQVQLKNKEIRLLLECLDDSSSKYRNWMNNLADTENNCNKYIRISELQCKLIRVLTDSNKAV